MLSKSTQLHRDRMVGAMVVRCWPVTIGIVFDLRAIYVGFVVGKSVTKTDISPKASVSPRQHHSTKALCLLVFTLILLLYERHLGGKTVDPRKKKVTLFRKLE